MSFDIFITAFENEDIYRFPISTLRERFAKHIIGDDGVVWCIGFDEGPGNSYVYLGGEEMIDGFCVNRPADYLEFWEIIAGILRDLPCLLYWPSTKPTAIMGSLDMLRNLPKDWVDRVDIPFVSTDPERIRQYVWDNS